MLTLTLRVMQKHAFSVHQIITPFTILCVLSQKISYAKKRIVWAMLKKEEKKDVHAKRHERKKCMPKIMRKRKEKERKK